jgi:hypothetical protein
MRDRSAHSVPSHISARNLRLFCRSGYRVLPVATDSNHARHCTSRNTTSGSNSRSSSTADAPSPHSPTISISLNLRSLSTRRAKGSSSTIGTRTVKPPASRKPCVTAIPARLRNPRFRPFKREYTIRPIKCFQAPRGVSETDSIPFLLALATTSGVSDHNSQPVCMQGALDPNPATLHQ